MLDIAKCLKIKKKKEKKASHPQKNMVRCLKVFNGTHYPALSIGGP